jgi:hypothetical protein
VILCGHTSITKWVRKMRSYPFYAIISGFLPYDVPGVGTFYDFMNLIMFRVPKEGRGLSRPNKKPDKKDGVSDKPKHSGIIKRLADRLLSDRKLPLRLTDASIIKEIFQAVFVAHSQNQFYKLSTASFFGRKSRIICMWPIRRDEPSHPPTPLLNLDDPK